MSKFQISRDSPALYITVVAKDRLPVFKSDAIKLVTCQALDEARKSGGFLLFSYVIMPDHLHFRTDCPKSSADVLRRVKGLIARRVIDYLQEYDYQSSLAKLRHQEWKRKHSYSPFGNKRRMFFRSSAKLSLCRKWTTYTSTRCELDWSSGQSTIGGRAREFGSGSRAMMDP